MIEVNGIRIQNIYYMLTYVYRNLQEQGYSSLAAEEFEGIPDMFASIIERGVAWQLKQGLYCNYVAQKDNLTTMRGKINLSETFRLMYQQKQLLNCEYDELSVNNVLNQILKTTIYYLLKRHDVSVKNKTNLKRELLMFGQVDFVNIADICWSRITFGNCNNNYRMLINICYLVWNGLIQNTSEGQLRMKNFTDDQSFCRLYEKFILQYYKYHYPNLHPVSMQIDWDVDDVNVEFLPRMQSDVTLRDGEKTLIIDAKYYSRTMQEQFGVKTVHSANLYQIFSYVKNLDIKASGNVAGMLLYAKTEEQIIPNFSYKLGGNAIYVKTLDLSKAFSEVRSQLNNIVDMYFGCRAQGNEQ